MTEDYARTTAEDFQEGRLILIDKPTGWTSFDAVKKVRYVIRKKFNLKKIKVGHAGTLDPLASGLLILCTGRFTKRIAALTLEDKTYTGTFTLGATTPSYDLETEIENAQDTTHITPDALQRAVSALSGVQQQMPPIFSAKKVDGKRAYDAARKGRDVELKPQTVEIKSFEVSFENPPEVGFKITCSKGTYIRAIARDLGAQLGTGAYLSELRRTHIAAYSVENSLSPMQFEEIVLGK